MREVFSNSIDYKSGQGGSVYITSTGTGAFQGFVACEDTVISSVKDQNGLQILNELGLSGYTVKQGIYIGAPKGRYISEITLTSGSIIGYYTLTGGIILPSSIDPDAAAFFARVTTAGGSLSEIEQTAVNTLVVQMKADGVWSKMKAVYPMVGASAAACAQNLKSSSFTGTFSSGWTFASTGVTPNGTSAYFNTTFNPNTQFTDNVNNHLSFYSRTQVTNISGYDINVYDGTNEFGLTHYYNAVSLKFFNAYAYPNQVAGANNTNTLGFLIGTRTASNLSKAYFNNSLLATQTNSIGSNVRPIYPIYIGATNNQNISIYQYSTRECALASIGDGLTDTEASDFYTAVQAFQTTLSRQV